MASVASAFVLSPNDVVLFACLAVLLQQIWWGQREQRVDPSNPEEPATIATGRSATLMFASITVVGLALWPDVRAFIVLAIVPVFGYYWLRTRRWKTWTPPEH